MLTTALVSLGALQQNIQVLRAMRAKASHAAADGSGRAYTVVQEAAELTALRDN